MANVEERLFSGLKQEFLGSFVAVRCKYFQLFLFKTSLALICQHSFLLYLWLRRALLNCGWQNDCCVENSWNAVCVEGAVAYLFPHSSWLLVSWDSTLQSQWKTWKTNIIKISIYYLTTSITLYLVPIVSLLNSISDLPFSHLQFCKNWLTYLTG
jgi:hypothetical protein